MNSVTTVGKISLRKGGRDGGRKEGPRMLEGEGGAVKK